LLSLGKLDKARLSKLAAQQVHGMVKASALIQKAAKRLDACVHTKFLRIEHIFIIVYQKLSRVNCRDALFPSFFRSVDLCRNVWKTIRFVLFLDFLANDCSCFRLAKTDALC
jgi:hypothetical protein